MSLEDFDNAVVSYKQALEVRNQALDAKTAAESVLAEAKVSADDATAAHAEALKAAADARDAVKATADALL